MTAIIRLASVALFLISLASALAAQELFEKASLSGQPATSTSGPADLNCGRVKPPTKTSPRVRSEFTLSYRWSSDFLPVPLCTKNEPVTSTRNARATQSKGPMLNTAATPSRFGGATSNEDSVDAQGQPSGPTEAQELAKKLSNPVASLISVPFQSNFDFRMGGTSSGWRYTLNFQPVYPIALSPKWNMISRTILPIIHQSDVVGTSSQSGLGDIVQSLFFSPNKSEPFVWAVGPVVLIPTATNDFLGSRQLGIGPTALVLKQQHGWTFGILGNHIWKVAGGSGHANVNATFLQPFLSYTTKDAWTYGINTESTYDWTGNHWAVPIIPSVSKLVRFGKQPVSFQVGLRCWATSPSGGPESCGLRFVVTPLFPKK